MPIRGWPHLFSALEWSETVVLFAILAGGAFCFWMFIDAVANEPEPRTRVRWALALGLLPYLAAPVYFALRYLPRRTARARTGS